MLWDTAGQEEFDAITKAYYRGKGKNSWMQKQISTLQLLKRLGRLKQTQYFFCEGGCYNEQKLSWKEKDFLKYYNVFQNNFFKKLLGDEVLVTNSWDSLYRVSIEESGKINEVRAIKYYGNSLITDIWIQVSNKLVSLSFGIDRVCGYAVYSKKFGLLYIDNTL